MSLRYPVGQSGETLIVTADVAAHLLANRQLKWWQSEGCGLLFARIAGQEIILCEATGPHERSWRRRFGCAIDPVIAQREIDDRHRSGLHYIGEWHSHPEPVPSPSAQDEATMRSRVMESSHALNGFVFILVGQSDLPKGLTVLVHYGTRSFTLKPD